MTWRGRLAQRTSRPAANRGSVSIFATEDQLQQCCKSLTLRCPSFLAGTGKGCFYPLATFTRSRTRHNRGMGRPQQTIDNRQVNHAVAIPQESEIHPTDSHSLVAQETPPSVLQALSFRCSTVHIRFPSREVELTTANQGAHHPS